MPTTIAFFYNRHQETQVLRQTLRSRRAELFILYGRRGVGKTALLERVLHQAGTPYIFYRATRRTLPLQLEALTEAVREVPITEHQQPRPRTSLYFVADPYLDFWHRFVDPARSLVARGLGARLWEQRMAPALTEYVSRPTPGAAWRL